MSTQNLTSSSCRLPTTLAILAALFFSGCSHTLRVIDQTGHPVTDAVMRIDYPSFNGPQFSADKNGIIHYSKGWFEPIQVIVTSAASGSALMGYPPPPTIMLDGRKWEESVTIGPPLPPKSGQ
jgi:hypothetical protein